MSRYIDADALRESLKDWFASFDWDDGEIEKHTIATVIRTVDSQPTADAVEVVRCKDCTRQMICFHSDDYFCADGERREDV